MLLDQEELQEQSQSQSQRRERARGAVLFAEAFASLGSLPHQGCCVCSHFEQVWRRDERPDPGGDLRREDQRGLEL